MEPEGSFIMAVFTRARHYPVHKLKFYLRYILTIFSSTPGSRKRSLPFRFKFCTHFSSLHTSHRAPHLITGIRFGRIKNPSKAQTVCNIFLTHYICTVRNYFHPPPPPNKPEDHSIVGCPRPLPSIASWGGAVPSRVVCAEFSALWKSTAVCIRLTFTDCSRSAFHHALQVHRLRM
jgi:hypothetical protein